MRIFPPELYCYTLHTQDVYSTSGFIWLVHSCEVMREGLGKLTSVADSLTGSFFRMALHCCWQASTSSRVRYSWANSSITWLNTQTPTFTFTAVQEGHRNVYCFQKESLYYVSHFLCSKKNIQCKANVVEAFWE